MVGTASSPQNISKWTTKPLTKLLSYKQCYYISDVSTANKVNVSWGYWPSVREHMWQIWNPNLLSVRPALNPLHHMDDILNNYYSLPKGFAFSRIYAINTSIYYLIVIRKCRVSPTSLSSLLSPSSTANKLKKMVSNIIEPQLNTYFSNFY